LFNSQLAAGEKAVIDENEILIAITKT
jgi:hypothetical protein